MRLDISSYPSDLVPCQLPAKIPEIQLTFCLLLASRDTGEANYFLLDKSDYGDPVYSR